MFHALPVAYQPGAGDRHCVMTDAAARDAAVGELLAQHFQASYGFGLQPAVGQLLDAVSEPALEEAAVVAGRLRAEELAPLCLQVG